jgi:hypothetical protein
LRQSFVERIKDGRESFHASHNIEHTFASGSAEANRGISDRRRVNGIIVWTRYLKGACALTSEQAGKENFMSQATATRMSQETTANEQQTDLAESMLRGIDSSTKQSTGISLFHILTLGSIGASIALFLSGKKEAGIFVGLWPPTFQALKAVTERNNKE